MTPGGPEQEAPVPGLSAAEAAALAERHGLTRVGIRPALGPYLRETWRKRRFLWTLSSSEALARNQDNYLGQLWVVLNPLLLAGAYLLVFGLLLDTTGGTENYIGFLTSGIFFFMFISGSLTRGSKSITSNTALVRALRFPRCVLPLSAALTELVANLPAFAVLLAIMFATGERPTWSWLLFPVAVLLVTLINAGLALITSRMVENSRDLANLVPVATRLLRYVSGVFFSIEAYAGQGLVGEILYYQPVAVALNIVRQCLLRESPVDPFVWAVAAGWGVLLFVGGLLLFWQAEAKYGRG